MLIAPDALIFQDHLSSFVPLDQEAALKVLVLDASMADAHFGLAEHGDDPVRVGRACIRTCRVPSAAAGAAPDIITGSASTVFA